jgi:hypothetical protein
MDCGTSKDTFSANKLGKLSMQSYVAKEFANLKSLDLDTLRGKIEIPGDDNVDEFSNVKVRFSGSAHRFSLGSGTFGAVSRP